MKTFSLRVALGVLTFLVGVSLTAFWMFNRESAKVAISDEVLSVPKLSVETLHPSSFSIESQISADDESFWEKEILGRFKELPLKRLPDAADETYRLVLLPTFNAPVLVRVWRSGGKLFLLTKKLNGVGGCGIEKLGKLSYQKKQTLTEAEWQTFTETLQQAQFSEMPPIDVREEPMMDGASWQMEGAKTGVFHTVRRNAPQPEFRQSCNYLLKLSGLESEYRGYSPKDF